MPLPHTYMWQIYNLVFMQVHQQLEGLEALIPCWSLVVLSGSLLKVVRCVVLESVGRLSRGPTECFTE